LPAKIKFRQHYCSRYCSTSCCNEISPPHNTPFCFWKWSCEF